MSVVLGTYSIFLCEQKTAYEMRISDGSSDVCSADLESFNRSTTAPRTSAAVIAAKVIWKHTNTYPGMTTPTVKVADVLSGVIPARKSLPKPEPTPFPPSPKATVSSHVTQPSRASAAMAPTGAKPKNDGKEQRLPGHADPVGARLNQTKQKKTEAKTS